MKLETHAKIGIWVAIVAIGITMSFFTVNSSQELKYEYGRLFVNPQEMYDKLATTGTADAFIEKFPYFYEDFEIRKDGSGRLELYAINNQTGNRIELDIRYDQDDDKMRENIHCNYNHRYYQLQEQAFFAMSSGSNSMREPAPEPFYPYLEGNARDQFVKDFIENTDCMLIPEPVENDKVINEHCGIGTTYLDGMCLVIEPEPIR